MPWYAWAVIAWLVIGSLQAVAAVGRPREPKTALEAVATLIQCGAAAWAVVELAT